MATRLEINFKRLLNRCEVLATERNEDDWRLEKYVGALQEQLSDIRKSAGKPSQEALAEYSRRVEFLRGIINTEKMPTSTERALQSELLIPALRNADHATASRELHIQTKAKYHKEMRDELLGPEQDVNNGLRQRTTEGSKAGSAEEDLDAMVKYHKAQQEKVTQEIIDFARNLKENARASNKIVQEDNKRLAKSLQQADINEASLKVEAERLHEHAYASCSWWIWVMIGLVILTFVWMVIFMRMFPKR